MANEYNDSAITEYETYFIGRNDIINRWGNIVSSWSFLPGLVGLWPMSSVQRSTGNVYDMSGQSRTLTYNGNPTYNIYNNFVPYIDFDGVGDYLYRADETDLDILGTETINAAAVQGLTFGGWFLAETANTDYLICKTNDANGPYALASELGVNILFRIRDSTDTTNYNVRIASAQNIWQFCVGRYRPSTEIKVWCNAASNTNIVGIPASILNGADDFAIGGTGAGTSLLQGYASLCFLSHQAFPDALVNAMFQQSRILFGV